MAGETLAAPLVGRARPAIEERARLTHEPDWLVELRLRALEQFERLPMPDQRTEGWRRTSLRGLDLDALDFDTPPSVSIEGAERVRVLDLGDPSVKQWLGQLVPTDADKFTALHYAFFNSAVVIRVPRNTVVEEPIWIRHLVSRPEQAGLVHTLLIADESSQVTVIEEFNGCPSVASGVVEKVIGPNANVRYVQLQRWAPETWSFSWQGARLDKDASLRTLNVAIGGRLARNTVQVALMGRGSQADLLGVAAAQDRQHVDFETLQDHFGDATRSDLVIHNALRGRSSANFTGLIRINKSAHQTESSQEQKNVLLSPQAKADSDPKLEILNNDVIRCTHGAAVGPLDADMLFYLQSRGLDLATAERLIVEGFFLSVLGKLELPSVQDAIWSAITSYEDAR